MTPKQYVNLVMSTPITGYDDYESGLNSSPSLKEEWLKAGRSIAKKLAKELGLAKGEFEVRVNRAGVAVSGDVHLHGSWIYVSLEQGCCSRDFGFMYRSCKGMKDYTGGCNRWAKWDELLDLKTLAEKMKRECMPVTPSTSL